MKMNATYSPEDNKLRLYASSRLDKDLYNRVKAAGFSWAPRQELFVAPMWTPGREDLLIELCGEIGDEDTSLVDRAEARADRFEDYSESRAEDADRAHKAVASIASNIPLGQPILVGHHSEKHARRDAEKIENGMRRAIKMWETSKYWEQRAAGAIRHAKYKELPAVRARRIKKLEADRRKVERSRDDATRALSFWSTLTTDLAAVKHFCNFHDHGAVKLADGSECYSAWSALDVGKITPEEIAAQRVPSLTRYLEGSNARWLNHYANRIAYERAMLDESGGLAGAQFHYQPGGSVLRRGSWYVVLKRNPQSVTVSGHFATTIPFDEIQDYREPTDEVAAAVRKIAKIPPLCNYPGEGFKHLTRAELSAEKCRRWSDFPKTGRINATDKHGAHRVQQTRGNTAFSVVGVYITDQKRTDPPPAPSGPRPDFKPKPAEREPRGHTPKPEPTIFDAMKDSLRAGVQVVSAPQLFPTPAPLANRLVELAELADGMDVLEPSAGTGNIIRALWGHGVAIHAVEINPTLCEAFEAMKKAGDLMDYRCGDFLTMNGDLGLFDRIVMNPPFERGADIQHIQHAREHLKPGGRIVAICANGPRQREALEPIATAWIDLEPGSFAESGTNVNTAIVVIDAD